MDKGEKRSDEADPGSSFTEDAPRPPVPGEEGDLLCSEGRLNPSPGLSSKNDGLRGDASTATPRRPDLDLGYEPEGSASPTPPYLKWAESLHSLLDDQDGIHLFRKFLEQEECADTLDFWFACSGFRKLEAHEGNKEKKVKRAKVIYKKFIFDNNGIVSRQIKPATKSFIKDSLMRLHIDPAMFDQAQAEIQTTMEENTYPLFLKSETYLGYARTGGESPKLRHSLNSATGFEKGLSSYLPTLMEIDDWRCDQGPVEQSDYEPPPSSHISQKSLIEMVSQRNPSSSGSQDSYEYRHALVPASPCYINTDHAAAPATSASESEQLSMYSDADSRSLTDSSLDGVPPHQYRKQHRREMHESAKANGRVPLPHFPRTNWIPTDIHVEPKRFAAELIRRLEGVLSEREAQEKLEERLRRVQLEEEGDNKGNHMSTASLSSSHGFPPAAHMQNYTSCYADVPHGGPFFRDAHEENPESILDDHVQRVMKTPGCQSPESRSPDVSPEPRVVGQSGLGKHCPRSSFGGEMSHTYLHQNTHHIYGGGRAKDQVEAEELAAFPPMETSHYGSKCRSYADGTRGSNSVAQCKRGLRKDEDVRPLPALAPAGEKEKNQKVLMWLTEGQNEAAQLKRTTYGSTGGSRRTTAHERSRLCLTDRSVAIHPCRPNVQPSHPFIQDPTMPPNPAPSPLIQLEEVCRRLEEEKINTAPLQPKQRYVMQVIQRGRTVVRPAVIPPLNVVPAVSDHDLCDSESKGWKKAPGENLTVAYYFCEEPIPYRTSVKGRVVTLGQFKELLTKKGNYRYYFKKVSDEFDCGVVFEEIREDDAVLPIYEEKIIGKVEKID